MVAANIPVYEKKICDSALKIYQQMKALDDIVFIVTNVTVAKLI